ncbi:MAG: META domain-containing protein [Prevotellaceae bacterium]|jgi:heat shock protein HslJ|nr:META domain-containing protein [Prevotellaceae bacterium]
MKCLIYSFLGFLIFQACSTANPAANKSETDITSLEWRLVSINSENGLLTTDKAKNPSTLKLSGDGTVHGQGGCNNFNGVAKISKNNIKFGNIAITNKACLDMTIESAYMKILSEVDSYSIESGDLKLKKGNTVLATFSTFR